MLFDITFLFLAGLFGGLINSVAGGGSFITFPALVFIGVPPVSANATNTFASAAGYLSGAYGFREDIKQGQDKLPVILVVSLVGGALGGWLLLQTPATTFQHSIPWLMLFATILFIYGANINQFIKQRVSQRRGMSYIGYSMSLLMLLAVCVYGGFFNAGLGIITLSYLALAGYQNINQMNGLKLLVSAAVSLSAIVLFILDGVIVWQAGLALLAGTLISGYASARLAKKLPPMLIRRLVIMLSFIITAYFFWDIYL